MEKLGIFILFLLTFILVYLLYINGFIQIKFTRAIGYIGFVGNSYKNYHKAAVTACSGSVKRVLKFKENREYTFILNSAVSKGTLRINILDSNKNIILMLDNETKRGSIIANPKEKYYLVIKYAKTDANYELSWK